MSKYEDYIAKILESENIAYEREKTFPDMRSLYGQPLRFDFFIPNIRINGKRIAIEYDSEIHFYNAFNVKNFSYRKECDRQKNKYCLLHDIALYRIPYFRIDQVKSFRDMLNEDFLVKDIYFNDKIKRAK